MSDMSDRDWVRLDVVTALIARVEQLETQVTVLENDVMALRQWRDSMDGSDPEARP